MNLLITGHSRRHFKINQTELNRRLEAQLNGPVALRLHPAFTGYLRRLADEIEDEAKTLLARSSKNVFDHTEKPVNSEAEVEDGSVTKFIVFDDTEHRTIAIPTSVFEFLQDLIQLSTTHAHGGGSSRDGDADSSSMTQHDRAEIESLAAAHPGHDSARRSERSAAA